MNWYFEVFRKYADFEGRARRTEYWTFTLVNSLINIFFRLFLIADGNIPLYIGILAIIYGLVIFIPSLAVSVRRLHDTDRSGWWLLLSFIPLVGPIVLLIFQLEDSNNQTNQYGPNPKKLQYAS